jgi:hypothetical protein
LGHSLLTNLKGKGTRHTLIELYSKFPTPMHGRKVEQQLKSYDKINGIINRQGSKILFTERNINKIAPSSSDMRLFIWKLRPNFLHKHTRAHTHTHTHTHTHIYIKHSAA